MSTDVRQRPHRSRGARGTTGHLRGRHRHQGALSGISLSYCETCKCWHARDTACRAAEARDHVLVTEEPHVPRI